MIDSRSANQRILDPRNPAETNGTRSPATVRMANQMIRSGLSVCLSVCLSECLSVDLLLVVLIFIVRFLRARFFRRGWIVLFLGRFGPPI